MTTTETTPVDLIGLYWSPLAHSVRFADLTTATAPTATDTTTEPTFVAPSLVGEQKSYIRPNGMEYLPRHLMVEMTKMQDVTLIRQSVKAGLPVLLFGEPGTGKTALVEAAFGDDLITIQGSVETEVADLVGSWVQLPDGTYQWVDGPLTVAADTGRPLLIDEIALIDSRVLAAAYGLMDGRDKLEITQNPLRGAVHVKPGFSITGACNPNVPGANMSDALLSRFATHVEMRTDWSIASKLGIGSKIVQVTRNLNEKYDRGEMTQAPQLRELIQFRDIAAQFGEQFALRNYVSQIRIENRALAVEAIAAVFGQTVTALVI